WRRRFSSSSGSRATPARGRAGPSAGSGGTPARFNRARGRAGSRLTSRGRARDAGKGTVGTVGEIEVDPSLINAIAEQVRFSLDIRGPVEDAYRGVARDIAAFAERTAAARGMSADYRERQTIPPTPMDERIVD